jgi:hypothetical protein
MSSDRERFSVLRIFSSSRAMAGGREMVNVDVERIGGASVVVYVMRAGPTECYPVLLHNSGERPLVKEVGSEVRGSHLVLIRVHAAGVNPIDWKVREELGFRARLQAGSRNTPHPPPADGLEQSGFYGRNAAPGGVTRRCRPGGGRTGGSAAARSADRCKCVPVLSPDGENTGQSHKLMRLPVSDES